MEIGPGSFEGVFAFDAVVIQSVVFHPDAAEWSCVVASAAMSAVERICYTRRACSVMLTGGRSAEALYQAWSAQPNFAKLTNVEFFFGDERCVPPDHPESNYALAMRTLFRDGVPPSCKITRMNAEHPDSSAAAAAYEPQLPVKLDVMLLSVGEDGHIASLFPHSPALFETDRRVVHVLAPNPPFERLTVTPRVITQAHQVFVMAIGKAKATVYEQAQLAPQDISELPARLVLNANWFFG